MNIPHHDVKSGYLKHCQICNSKKLKTIINLGKQPLADSLLKKKIPKKKVKPISLENYTKLNVPRDISLNNSKWYKIFNNKK